MIERYTLPEMAAIWSPENKFRIWLDIEIAACEALAKRKEIPQSAVNTIKQKAGFNIKRIDAIEKEVKHDVIAFLTSVAEHVGDAARYMHLGMTSSDVLDTALAVQLRDAADLILNQLKKFRAVLKKQAKRYKNTPTIGRSHGIHAEPTSFGLKLANWYEEVGRNIERMKHARKSISVGQISGAVGVFASIDPSVEAYVCKKLKLKPAPVSSQIIQRDRHAEYFTTLAIVAGTLDKFAVEIRHLQRTEVLEVEEFFSKGQKGSSAMPHKRNPVVSEQMSGLARVVRGNALAAMENMPLMRIVADQQRQLDNQQRQLELQASALNNLQQQIQSVQQSARTPSGVSQQQAVFREVRRQRQRGQEDARISGAPPNRLGRAVVHRAGRGGRTGL